MLARQVFIGTLVVVATLLAFYLAYLLHTIILTLIIAFIFAAAIRPLVDRMSRRGLPRALAILVVYLNIILILVVTLLVVVPPLVQQSVRLIETAPQYIEQYEPVVMGFIERFDQPNGIPVGDALQQIAAQAPGLATQLFRFTVSFFGAVFGAVIIFILALYWLLERDKVVRTWAAQLPPHSQVRAMRIFLSIENKMGAWIRGQLIVALAVGVATYLALVVLGIPFALVLAILALLLEFIPILGPVIAAIPAILIALAISPGLALITLVAYIVIQQLESYVLVPKIMEQAVGVSPLTVLVAVLVGGQLGGIVGIILAVPIAAAIQLVVKDFYFRDPDECGDTRPATEDGHRDRVPADQKSAAP